MPWSRASKTAAARPDPPAPSTIILGAPSESAADCDGVSCGCGATGMESCEHCVNAKDIEEPQSRRIESSHLGKLFPTGKKTQRGEPGHTRETRAHTGTRITQTNHTTIQTHEHTRTTASLSNRYRGVLLRGKPGHMTVRLEDTCGPVRISDRYDAALRHLRSTFLKVTRSCNADCCRDHLHRLHLLHYIRQLYATPTQQDCSLVPSAHLE